MVALDGKPFTSNQGHRGLPPADLGLTPEQRFLMDLQVALRNSQAPVHRAYLPVRSQGFSPALATWMAASGVQGQVPLAIFEYHGSLLQGASVSVTL